jgi:hypothetical protein
MEEPPMATAAIISFEETRQTFARTRARQQLHAYMETLYYTLLLAISMALSAGLWKLARKMN